MKALSILYPVAYLSGVVRGDGWVGAQLGLRVLDREFAEAFADAIQQAFGRGVAVRFVRDRYWEARTSNGTGQFDFLYDHDPELPEGRAAWIRGLFDSDGNANLSRRGETGNSYDRRVAIYKTDRDLLIRARRYLASMDLPTRIRKTTNSESHWGDLPVFELALKAGQARYRRFAQQIGSSIPRKQSVLDAIPESYVPDFSAHCRAAQLKGARAKRKKTMEETLPKVVDGVRRLIEEGVKPTQRNCRSIPGYNTIQPLVPQAELVAMAEEDL